MLHREHSNTRNDEKKKTRFRNAPVLHETTIIIMVISFLFFFNTQNYQYCITCISLGICNSTSHYVKAYTVQFFITIFCSMTINSVCDSVIACVDKEFYTELNTTCFFFADSLNGLISILKSSF